MIKSKHPILSILLVLFLTCVLIPLSLALRPQEVAETVLPSTVLITMTNASGQSYIGSGFVVGTGQIATNHHVIKGIASGKVKLVGDTTEHVIESVSIVDINRDLAIVKASSLTASALTLGDSDTVQAWLDMAYAADDGSLAFKAGIALLQRFLAAMHPAKTELLANYPNPFNPETWIPYHLAHAADVAVTIYVQKVRWYAN